MIYFSPFDKLFPVLPISKFKSVSTILLSTYSVHKLFSLIYGSPFILNPVLFIFSNRYEYVYWLLGSILFFSVSLYKNPN